MLNVDTHRCYRWCRHLGVVYQIIGLICEIHQLLLGDYQRRMEFCNWALNNIAKDPNFGARMIFTDESTFIRHGKKERKYLFYCYVCVLTKYELVSKFQLILSNNY